MSLYLHNAREMRVEYRLEDALKPSLTTYSQRSGNKSCLMSRVSKEIAPLCGDGFTDTARFPSHSNVTAKSGADTFQTYA